MTNAVTFHGPHDILESCQGNDERCAGLRIKIREMIRLSARIAFTSQRGTASVACTASTNLRRKQLVCLTTARSPPHTAPTSIGHDERSNVRCQPTSCLSTAAATHPHAKTNVTEERRLIQQREQRFKTPPVEEESGPAIRDMRAQLRSDSESGSRGSRRVRKAGKIPGVVYSNNDSSPKGSRGEPFRVQVDKIIVDREIRRLKASFDNTVYNLVIEGAAPTEEDEEDAVKIAVGDPDADAEGVQGGNGDSAAVVKNEGPKERRELVLANECRLHPVLRTVMSVNWMRYKAGRKYPIPIKFINSDLNDNFKKGAYIRRLKTHQHIHLPDDPAKVPKWLYLDLEFVRSGNKLRVSDIIIPDGIRFFRGNEPDMWKEIVCTIKGKKAFSSRDGDEEEEEDED